MEQAFNKFKKGREEEVEQMTLIFFDKEKSLLKKHKALKVMFEDYRKDILREFTIKEDICTSVLNEKKILMGELEMAKLIIGDKDLC